MPAMKYLSASYQIKKSHTLTKNSNHRDGPTDVLAFSLGEAKDEIIADILYPLWPLQKMPAPFIQARFLKHTFIACTVFCIALVSTMARLRAA